MKAPRRITLAATVAALAITSAACGSAEPKDAAGDTEPPQTTIPIVTQDSEPEADPVSDAPTSFAEVESEYEAGVSTALAAGRVVADEFLADDVEAIHAKLDAGFAAALSVEAMRAGRSDLAAQAALGERGVDRAVPLSPALSFYQAELEWGNDTLAMTVSFNEAGEISGLILVPQQPLPNDPAADFESAVSYRLPFNGLWYVFWGGDTETENYHVVAPDQRHAFDIVVWKDGGTHTGDGFANEDYWAYGQPVLSPAKGTVVTAVDGLADQNPQVGSDQANPAGNHVVIEVADGEYVLIAHMKTDSITVAAGDSVESGQQIGLVGNSGNTSEPHIHIHVQDQPVFNPQATGLPLAFTDYTSNGQAVEEGQPVGGQFVANGR